MKTLYAELRVDTTGELAVDDLHRIYWEVSGNPDGIPVLFIHGGPGAGSSHNDRRFSTRPATVSSCLISAAAAAPRLMPSCTTTPVRT